MLTREEQEAVMQDVAAIRKQALRLQVQVDRKMTDPKRMRELMQIAEDKLRERLKEIG